MSNQDEMPKAYDPRQVEERLYDWWEARGYFQPRIDPKKKPFVISIPPPNVTGELHHGHAMFIAFEDLMIRWRRMMGDPTLWVPGSDHAGIATQNVVEKALAKQGITRQQLGREEFVKRVWEWKAEYGGIITHQIRRLGASCDWTRERFTLDDGLSRAVREAFVRLYEKGLIYRGPRLINWCPRCETAISDLEVEHEDTTGKLYYVRYKLEPESPISNLQPPEFIMVATTRPETILGDTAVAVHPRDKRYKHLMGRIAILPALGRRIPIIADDAVDPEFGTGAVKVTPGHDATDYDIGQRHHLQIINVMNNDATIRENGGPYAGMDRYAARAKFVQDLQRDGLLDHVQDHAMSIGRCQRCDTIVEPLISTQWFVKIAPLAQAGIKAVKRGDIKIVPARFNKVYFDWMTHIRDWCISRQLWWGHRIPVWYCEHGHQTCAHTDPTECAVCGSQNLTQDEDVLDTWFSSGLWPFSTLGWPDETEDYKYFYPTSVLETGYDILFFWVARMIMDGLEFTGKAPFHTVYLHGLMRDEKGEKMSKSKGNVANPLDVVRDYSADALRFTIVTASAPGADMKLFPEKLENARNFGNKIWNIARFVVSNLEPSVIASEAKQSPNPGEIASSRSFDSAAKTAAPLRTLLAMTRDALSLVTRHSSLSDRWILSRLNHLVAAVTEHFENWNFGEGDRQIYEFLWSEFADWYIEASKVALYGTDESAQQRTRAILAHTLDTSLRLLHPTMPFVTEEAWQHLKRAEMQDARGETEPEALMIAPWPKASKKFFDARAEKEFAVVMDIIRAIRNARAEFNVEPGKKIAAVISAGSAFNLLESQREVIAALARLDPAALQIAKRADKPAQSLALVAAKSEVYLPLAGMIDVEKEHARLTNEIAKVRGDIARAEKLLASEFSTRAPKDVVQKARAQLAANQERLGKLDAQLAGLEGRRTNGETNKRMKGRAKPVKGTKAAQKTQVAKGTRPARRKRLSRRRTTPRATGALARR